MTSSEKFDMLAECLEKGKKAKLTLNDGNILVCTPYTQAEDEDDWAFDVWADGRLTTILMKDIKEIKEVA